MSRTHNTTRIIGGMLCLAGVVAAGVLIFLPLPTVNAFGGPVAWCGPGTTSASALRVITRPYIVNDGADGNATPEQRAALEEVCKGEAGTRFKQAGIVGIACIVLGGAVMWLGRKGPQTS